MPTMVAEELVTPASAGLPRPRSVGALAAGGSGAGSSGVGPPDTRAAPGADPAGEPLPPGAAVGAELEALLRAAGLPARVMARVRDGPASESNPYYRADVLAFDQILMFDQI
jgi:hypothetical protein